MPIKQPPGGNPKIAQDRPTPEQFLAAFPLEMRGLAEQMRQLINQARKKA